MDMANSVGRWSLLCRIVATLFLGVAGCASGVSGGELPDDDSSMSDSSGDPSSDEAADEEDSDSDKSDDDGASDEQSADQDSSDDGADTEDGEDAGKQRHLLPVQHGELVAQIAHQRLGHGQTDCRHVRFSRVNSSDFAFKKHSIAPW